MKLSSVFWNKNNDNMSLDMEESVIIIERSINRPSGPDGITRYDHIWTWAGKKRAAAAIGRQVTMSTLDQYEYRGEVPLISLEDICEVISKALDDDMVLADYYKNIGKAKKPPNAIVINKDIGKAKNNPLINLSKNGLCGKTIFKERNEYGAYVKAIENGAFTVESRFSFLV